MPRIRHPWPRRFRPGEPFFLQWHLTAACNLRCGHCYQPGKGEGGAPGPDLDQARQALAGFRALRPRAPFLPARVQLAGGEPLLAPRLFEILTLIRGEGLPMRILTNGTLVGAAEARALAAAGVAIVQVSLDGLEETHDRCRGPGAFGRALPGSAICGPPVYRPPWPCVFPRTISPTWTG